MNNWQALEYVSFGFGIILLLVGFLEGISVIPSALSMLEPFDSQLFLKTFITIGAPYFVGAFLTFVVSAMSLFLSKKRERKDPTQ